MKAATLVPLLLVTALPAQCLFTSLTTTSVGPGCNVGSTGYCKVVGLPTTLSTSLDPANCRLEVQIHLFEACGVTVPLRLLAFGFQPATVPLPEFGPGCVLAFAPLAVLSWSTGPIALDLPPGVAALSFLVQGAALSIAPPGGQGLDALTFSDALRVDLQ